ncbi:acyl-CoA dehydrogenase [Streptomyces xiamenensis]|uniref:acyl-CoA dehydrogenase family protein n=1 Tax=Streptomyces xiamenensis TaxID=408015 RepID=UPI0036E52044
MTGATTGPLRTVVPAPYRAPTAPGSASGLPDSRALTDLLLRDGPGDPHTFWRGLLRDERLHHHPELRREERHRETYDRLRLVNERHGDALALARDPRALAAAHEWLAVADGALATVAGIHYNLFLGSLLDDDRSAPRDLRDITAMDRVGTFLCTEYDHGNDAAALRTTARHDPGSRGFVLHTPDRGARKYMPNTGPAGGPKSAVVAARLLVAGEDHGVFLFLTPLSDADGPLPGIRIEELPDRVGSPVDHCATTFDGVRLPYTALLQGAHGTLTPDGRFDSAVRSPRRRFLSAIGRVTTGKLCMSAATLGGARAALAIAIRHAHQRHISGPSAGRRVPLAAHRSHTGRLLEAVAHACAMTFLHRRTTAAAIDAPAAERAEAERAAAIAKGWITWQARQIITEARERCGARGLFPVNGLAEHAANTEGAITAEGDNLAIWCKAGAELLFAPTPSVNPAAPPGTRDVTDPDALRALLAAAETCWHERARADLRSGPRGDSLARWNGASGAVLELVALHAAGRAADAFAAAEATVGHGPTRSVLNDLRRLFLLRTLAGRTGELLADGHLTADQVRDVPAAVERTIARLTPHLACLGDAFGLPEEYLASLPMLSEH